MWSGSELVGSENWMIQKEFVRYSNIEFHISGTMTNDSNGPFCFVVFARSGVCKSHFASSMSLGLLPFKISSVIFLLASKRRFLDLRTL